MTGVPPSRAPSDVSGSCGNFLTHRESIQAQNKRARKKRGHRGELMKNIDECVQGDPVSSSIASTERERWDRPPIAIISRSWAEYHPDPEGPFDNGGTGDRVDKETRFFNEKALVNHVRRKFGVPGT